MQTQQLMQLQIRLRIQHQILPLQTLQQEYWLQNVMEQQRIIFAMIQVSIPI